MGEHFLAEDDRVGQGAGGGIKIGNPQQHEYIPDPGRDECLDGGIPGRGLCIPESDQQVGAQPHDFPPNKQGQQVIRYHQRVHAEGKQAQEGEKAGIHRFD